MDKVTSYCRWSFAVLVGRHLTLLSYLILDFVFFGLLSLPFLDSANERLLNCWQSLVGLLGNVYVLTCV